ncbi:hypothetical protein QBC47DRAFT_370751 [Echria macrotheca]|uniref:Uncharacterized protein n=1 Tax=Echria macrotheca TaxID=438768 RepID=A0AAJ0BIH7_9PEZI|nr:hypothetical protein QBC47DRAFT_370751 [Echria macrotheca]
MSTSEPPGHLTPVFALLPMFGSYLSVLASSPWRTRPYRDTGVGIPSMVTTVPIPVPASASSVSLSAVDLLCELFAGRLGILGQRQIGSFGAGKGLQRIRRIAI